VRIDQQSDALYVDLTGREIESSAEVADGIIVDYDKEGRLVGIEILDASKKSGVSPRYDIWSSTCQTWRLDAYPA
jgi:uncharacterized protein YuzE